MERSYMAIDQYGQSYHGLEHPRKDLMKRLGMSRADKMFVDEVDGKVYHSGYVIGGLWLTVYEVQPMRRPV